MCVFGVLGICVRFTTDDKLWLSVWCTKRAGGRAGGRLGRRAGVRVRYMHAEHKSGLDLFALSVSVSACAVGRRDRIGSACKRKPLN